MSEHFLDEQCLKMMADGEPDGFTWARSGIIADAVTQLTGCACLLTLPDLPPEADDSENELE